MDLNGDVIGFIVTYVYVIILFLISEKVLKSRPSFARKFTHIMVGNIIFLLPIFLTREVMGLLVTLPIVIGSFLMTKYSPIKINNSISSSGHSLGLFYYSISLTVLTFFFYNQQHIFAVGLAAMAYGDGFASLIGQKFGKHKYSVFGDTKSIEGSLTMFLVLILTLSISLGYYAFITGNPAIMNIFAVLAISAAATIVEGITPKGLDNLTVCFVSVVLYILLFI